MIIAIDGPAGSGKSTVAKLLAKELNHTYIDTGAMYRAVTLVYLEWLAEEEFDYDANSELIVDSALAKLNSSLISRILENANSGALHASLISQGNELKAKLRDDHKEKILSKLMDAIEIKIVGGETYANGQNLGEEIRSSLISSNVSEVSAFKVVRTKLVDQQRKMGESGDVILDGRDIGTVVFPNADSKFFLVASPEVRAKRRLLDLEARGEEVDLEALIADIKARDKYDSERSESPLKKADDAIEIDTSGLDIKQVVAKLKQELA